MLINIISSVTINLNFYLSDEGKIQIFLLFMKFLRLIVVACILVAQCSAYTPSLAIELGYYSSIAYQSVANINAWSCEKCSKYVIQNPQAFSNTTGDIQGFTGYSPNLNAIILAFRGSSTIENWFINLSLNQVGYSKCEKCKVHNGFQAGYNAVKASVISQIKALKALHNDSKIYLTGHSLGGALAVMALPDVKENFGDVEGLLTFGQPRVGNSQFASWLGAQVKHERVVHYGDPVPHAPAKINGYRHSGTEIWYDKAMQTYKTCQGDSSGCSNSLSVTKLKIKYHLMNTYLTLKVDDATSSHMKASTSSWAKWRSRHRRPRNVHPIKE